MNTMETAYGEIDEYKIAENLLGTETQIPVEQSKLNQLGRKFKDQDTQ